MNYELCIKYNSTLQITQTRILLRLHHRLHPSPPVANADLD